MKVYLRLLVVLAAALGLYAIYKKSQESEALEVRYGREFNKTRDSLDLPIIESSWGVRHTDSMSTWWLRLHNPIATPDPIHIWKKCFYSGGKLFQEEDAFHYETLGDNAYRLIVNYRMDFRDSSEFKLIKYEKEGDPPDSYESLTFSQGDSVLHAWGLKGLYNNLVEKR